LEIARETRQAYTELDNFMELLDESKKKKVPQKLRAYFKQEKDTNYRKEIDIHVPIKEQNLKEETLALIALLNLQYWCENEEEKIALQKIYAQNEEKYQEDLREKYNPDNLFQNRRKIQENLEEKQLVEVKEKSWIQKILQRIRQFFKKET